MESELEFIQNTIMRTSKILQQIASSQMYRQGIRTLVNSENEKLRMFQLLTKNGTVLPQIMPFDEANSKVAKLIKIKVDKYNLTADEKDKINYTISMSTDGKSVIWVDEKSAKKIEQFRYEVMMSRSGFFTEIKPSELLKANIGKESVTLTGISREELDILKNKPVPGENHFSFAAKENENGTYDVIIKKSDYMSAKEEDMFTNLLRAKAISKDETNKITAKELAYDRELKSRIVDYDKKYSTYITSAIDGGSYMKVSNKGFTVYSVGTNGNDVFQTIKQHVSISDEGYKEKLADALSKINKPVEINKDVYEKNKGVLENTFGKEALLSSPRKQVVNFTTNRFLKTTDEYVQKIYGEPKDLKDQLTMSAISSKTSHMAALVTCRMSEVGATYDKEKIDAIINDKTTEKEIKESFFKSDFEHLSPDLYNKFVHELENTDLYKEIQLAATTPELKEELTNMLNNSYSDFLKAIPGDLQADIQQEYEKYKDAVKGGLADCLHKNLTPELLSRTEKILNMPTNSALGVVLANCVSGKVIEGIRPMITSIPDITKAELADTLAKYTGIEIEKNIIEKYQDKDAMQKAIQNPFEMKKIINDTICQLKNDYVNGTLSAKSEAWKEISDGFDKNGGITDKVWDNMSQAAAEVANLEKSTNVIDLSAVTQAEMSEAGSDYWNKLEYEHSEEFMNNLMRETLDVQDINMNTKEIEESLKDLNSDFDLNEENREIDNAESQDYEEEYDPDEEEFEMGRNDNSELDVSNDDNFLNSEDEIDTERDV